MMRCRLALQQRDILSAVTAYRDASGPANIAAANSILEAATPEDKLLYTAAHRCCDRTMEQQRQTGHQRRIV
jgi:hypothetical protein